ELLDRHAAGQPGAEGGIPLDGAPQPVMEAGGRIGAGPTHAPLQGPSEQQNPEEGAQPHAEGPRRPGSDDYSGARVMALAIAQRAAEERPLIAEVVVEAAVAPALLEGPVAVPRPGEERLGLRGAEGRWGGVDAHPAAAG